MKVLFNIYVVIFFFVFGPEAVAKSLPMKKVQTVETVWIPMEESEVEELEAGIEAVEIKEGQEGAVPLFKEAIVAEEIQPEAVVVEEVAAGVRIQTPPLKEGEQRPIIQVIYQGIPKPQKKVEPPVEEPEVVEVPAVVEAPVIGEVPPIVEEKIEAQKRLPSKKKKPGDVYNFYFRS